MAANDSTTGASKRKQTRFPVSDDCRVRASISIKSSDEASANKDWPGTLVDVSAGGAHIQISLGAVAYTGNACVLKLAHGGVKVELRGTLAHYVCSARHSVCGVKFDAFATGWDRSYLPFFKALVASSTLKGGATGSDAPGRYREEYSGSGESKLVVWRSDKPERPLVGFDFAMGRFGAELGTVGDDMFKNKAEVRFTGMPAASGGDRTPLSRAHEAEARWEFSIAASNLPASLAPDIRKLLRLVS